MRAYRIVVVDDDHWKRAAMAAELDAHPTIATIDVIDQDEAVAWPAERWEDVDIAIVDVFDENAPAEVGTDVFSGIAALERLKDLQVRTLAITPHCQHPLIQLRIHQAGADWLYHRWEVNDLDRLVAAIIDPQEDHVPLRPPEAVLAAHGSRRAQANQAVRLYEGSSLFGLLRPELGLKSLTLPRRTVDRFRRGISKTGFEGTEDLSLSHQGVRTPRWPDVRDFVLTLIGRHDVPATEVDRDDGTGGHP